MSSRVSGVLLAAGESSRLPGPIPKQLLLLEGEPLVRRLASRALASRLDELIVVVGHQAERVEEALAGLQVRTVLNSEFSAGQSTSVRAGLAAVDSRARAALFLVADQPYLTAGLIDRLVEVWEQRGAPIVVPVAAGRRGSPVLFARALFAELAAITGDVGGRQLFSRHRSRVEEVEVGDPRLLQDFDTGEELGRPGDHAPSPAPAAVAPQAARRLEASTAPCSGSPQGAGIQLIARAAQHPRRLAVIAEDGDFTYRQLLSASSRVASGLLGGLADLAGRRVAFLVSPGSTWVALQWGIWRAGGVAVPLALSHPLPELEHLVSDSGAEILVAAPDLAGRLQPIAEARGLRVASTADLLAGPEAPLPAIAADRRAMIVYTSGTSGRPKGAVTTHRNIAAQIESLIEAWEWSAEDRILLALPLHHVHGIINVVGCALWSGAACEMLPAFDAAEVWRRLGAGRISLFMAVPTIYRRLIESWEALEAEDRRRLAAACAGVRLMVSGSAALPVRLLEHWREITGHTLLERYGMTEIGMALSNPLRGERRPGHVGRPLPGVEVRLVDEGGEPVAEGTAGEIEVRGPGVFDRYWGHPEATRSAFRGGWFRTGDLAVVEKGSYRILGRRGLDIIKSGGFKVSALEVEEALREHPAVAECAVVGVPDPEWGERVAVAVVPAAGQAIDQEGLRDWAKRRLAPYKVPTLLLLLSDLPRNVMGKVTKPDLVERFVRLSAGS